MFTSLNIVQICMSVIALFVRVQLLAECVRDWRVMRDICPHDTAGKMRLVSAKKTAVQGSLIMVVHVLMVVVGGLFLSGQAVYSGVALTVIRMVFASVFLLSALIEHYARREMLAIWDADRPVI